MMDLFMLTLMSNKALHRDAARRFGELPGFLFMGFLGLGGTGCRRRG